MNLDTVSRFDGTVENYVKYRPNYPKVLFDYLTKEFGDRRPIVCELGAGTGIFTRQLASANIASKIIAVEPNHHMRHAAECESQRDLKTIVEFMSGHAEKTGLPTGSVDCVLGAQCFHWFDLDRALPEIERITKAGSWSYAIWNDRVPVGFNEDLEELLRKMSKGYVTLHRPETTIQALKERLPEGSYVEFDHIQELNLDALIGRMASTSYVLHGVGDKTSFNCSLEHIFDKHQEKGLITMIYKTRVFKWKTQGRPRL